MSKIYEAYGEVSLEGRYAAIFAHRDREIVDVFDLQERRHVRRGKVPFDSSLSCTVAGTILYGGKYNGGVHAVDMVTGEKLWRQPKVQKLQRILFDDCNAWLYCQHDDFQTTILNAEDGEVVQKLKYWWLPMGEGDYTAGSVFEEGVLCRKTKSWEVVTTLDKEDLLPGMEKETPFRNHASISAGGDIYFCYNTSSDPYGEEETYMVRLDTARGARLRLGKFSSNIIWVKGYDKRRDLVLAIKPQYGDRPAEVMRWKRQTLEVVQSTVWTDMGVKYGGPGSFVFGGSHLLTGRGYLISLETLEAEGSSLFESAPATLLPLMTPEPEEISEEEKELDRKVDALWDRIRATDDLNERSRLHDEKSKLYADFQAWEKAKQKEQDKKN